jgi:3-hydroxyacyl-CoA dehydrogenase
MKDSELIGIVGAGQMGRGIAQVVAQSGFEVHLMDSSRDALDVGIAGVLKDLQRLVAKRFDARSNGGRPTAFSTALPPSASTSFPGRKATST